MDFHLKNIQKMGKTRKGFKNEVRTQEKTPLDEQILSGKVARSKNKMKIRLRAEEEDVSTGQRMQFKVNNFFNEFSLISLISMSMRDQRRKFYKRPELSRLKLH